MVKRVRLQKLDVEGLERYTLEIVSGKRRIVLPPTRCMLRLALDPMTMHRIFHLDAFRVVFRRYHYAPPQGWQCVGTWSYVSSAAHTMSALTARGGHHVTRAHGEAHPLYR
jgi:hypothetical protein